MENKKLLQDARLFARSTITALLLLSLFLFQNCNKVDFAQSETGTEESSSTSPALTEGSAQGSLSGTVSNALTGAALTGASIYMVDSSRTSYQVTSSSGQYSQSGLSAGTAMVNITLSGYASVSGLTVEIPSGGSATLNTSLSPNQADGNIRIVLNWTGPKSGAVMDVDAYLSIPSDSYPVYFDRQVGTGARLDIDIVDWYGPETITISSLQSGTYTYYVNNYDTRRLSSALGSSDVRISVYKGNNLEKSYVVPAGTGITYEVFRIVNGQIVDVLKFNDNLPIAY